MKHFKRLTTDQRAEILKHIPIGGDLISLCNLAGVTVAQFRLEIKRDPAFAEEVARAEATVELLHMGNVKKAAQDEKNWRAGVWWIERRCRLRAAGDGRAFSDAHAVDLVDEVAQVVTQQIPDPDVSRRVVDGLVDLIERETGDRTTDPSPDEISIEMTKLPSQEDPS